jgi:hypothetical protein
MNKNTQKERLKKRNEKIKQKFIALSNKRFGIEKLYTNKAIFAMLSEQFFLSSKTIENIVFSKED